MDLSLAEERMAGYQAFANKIWNASRFVLMNIQGEEFRLKEEELTLADRWIRSRLVGIVEELHEALENFKFYDAANKIYHFIWGEFCDWYIELVKPSLKQGNRTSEAVLVDTLDQILRLLHPFMPFITEEIWQHIPSSGKSLVVTSFPQARKDLRDEQAEKEMRFLQEAIVGIRTIRAENRIPPKKKVDLYVKVKDERKVGKKAEAEIIRDTKEYIQTLANICQVEILDHFPRQKKLLKGIAGSWEIAIPIEEGVFNLNQEKQRLEKELSKIMLDIEKIETRLKNTNFLNRAPKEVIKETKGKLRDLQGKKTKLEESLEHILSLI
jgi:valyl-tRNA synthetase